jgi:hypothetical protein
MDKIIGHLTTHPTACAGEEAIRPRSEEHIADLQESMRLTGFVNLSKILVLERHVGFPRLGPEDFDAKVREEGRAGVGVRDGCVTIAEASS